jgi:cytochrome c
VGGNWDFDKMDAWLTSPRKFASGTKMTFAGLAEPAGPRERDRLSQRAGLEPAAAGAPAAGAPAEPAGNAAEPDTAISLERSHP